jgi:hypothetical protein
MTRTGRASIFRRVGSAAIVLGLVCLTACERFNSTSTAPPSPPSRSSDSPIAPPDQPAETSPTPPPGSVYLIRVTIMTVEVPVDQASGSEELWSLLDEEPLSLQSHVLGLNGFRVGIGQNELWTDARNILQAMTGKQIKIGSFHALAGEPGSIILGKLRPARLFFIYHEDRSLSGRDLPPGDDLLTFSCGIDPDHRDRILLTALPQLRTTRQFPQVVQEPAQPPRIVSQPKYFPLEPMTFQLRVDRGDFLVIGPGIQARRPNSPGHHMLTHTREGMTFERIVVLKPEVILQEVSPPRPATPPEPTQ